MNLISKLLSLPWNTYSLEQTICRLQADLLTLKLKVMQGDYNAAHMANEKLAELEKLNVEFINS